MNEFATTFQDIPRYYTAIAEWLGCILILGISSRHLTGKKLYLAGGLTLLTQIIYMQLTADLWGILWVLCMLGAIGLMFNTIHVIFETNWQETLFYGAGAFIIAEFMASLQWMLFCYAILQGWPELPSRYISLVLIYGGTCLLKLWGDQSRRPQKKMVEPTSHEARMVAIIAAVIFVASNMSFLITNTPLSASYFFTIYQLRTLVDIIGVAVLYAYYAQAQTFRILQDKVKVEAILQTQYQQYEQSREVQDNINFKYHDLKQYITIMRSHKDDNEQTEILDRIESEIADYETQNKTGNHVLDTLLGAKSITCKNQKILLTTVINGSLLSFMDTVDICSIFGNALDNAIEFEKTIPDPQKRMINLTVVDRNQAFLVIRCENYYEGYADMTLEKKLPQTTKPDKSLHGYGLRSIQHAAHKYGGEMDIEVRDNWFRLKILIPLDTGKK